MRGLGRAQRADRRRRSARCLDTAKANRGWRVGRYEMREVTGRLIRAAGSIAANVAEGYSRSTGADRRRLLAGGCLLPRSRCRLPLGRCRRRTAASSAPTTAALASSSCRRRLRGLLQQVPGNTIQPHIGRSA